MDNRFWKEANENGDVCIGHQHQVAAYINVNNDIVIRQEDPMDDDDSIIVINRCNLQDFINSLIALVDVSK
ncbi:MAG: hypothetical protein ACYC4K_06155 [Thiobacillus sp.]